MIDKERRDDFIFAIKTAETEGEIALLVTAYIEILKEIKTPSVAETTLLRKLEGKLAERGWL